MHKVRKCKNYQKAMECAKQCANCKNIKSATRILSIEQQSSKSYESQTDQKSATIAKLCQSCKRKRTTTNAKKYKTC